MSDNKNYFTLRISSDNDRHVRLIKLLQSKKFFDRDVKSLMMEPAAAYYQTYEVGEDSNSTREDVLESLINSFNSLSGQMSNLAAYAQSKYGIDPDVWKRFGLLPTPVAPTYDRPPLIAQSPVESTGDRLTRENQQRSDEIDRELASREIAPVAQTASKRPPAVIEPDEDDDDDDDLSPEEYEAKMRASMEDPTRPKSFKLADSLQ